MSAPVPLRPPLRYLRRLATGAVLAYGFASLAFGGTSAARPVFLGLAVIGSAGLWAAQLPAGTRLRQRVLGNGLLRFLRIGELVATNVALTLVLAEVSLRLFASWAGPSLLVSNELDTYRLTPGHDYGGGLRGNALGYPGSDFVCPKRPGIFRIAALGDSFAVGPAVRWDDNYLTLLERARPGVEVYNFGVSGTGPREYELILRRDVWTYEPDLVLLSLFVGNDITETLATPRHLDPRQHAVYLLLFRSLRLAQEHWRGEPVAAATSDRLAGPALSEPAFRAVEARRLAVCLEQPPPGVEKKWQSALRYLDHISDDCHRHGVPLAVVLIPDEFQVNPDVLACALETAAVDRQDVDLEGPQRRLLRFWHDRGVTCLDLMPAFTGVRETYAPRDTHWNARGNRLAATEIAAWLRSAP